MKTIFRKRRFIFAAVILLGALACGWLVTTNNSAIWPVRNVIQYRVLTWWWDRLAQPTDSIPGTLHGTVRDTRGRPITRARVLVSRRDGTTYSTQSDALGNYLINNIPPGTYRPVAGASGYDSVQFGDLFGQVTIRAGQDAEANVILPVEPALTLSPGQEFSLGEPLTVTCASPLESKATRQQIHFISGNQPNQASFYYKPVTATTTSRLPILLAIYPGPADSWECASLPLAQAGYAVLATGPAYSFDLEEDIDELARLLAFARKGQFPEGDGSRIALLGGSFSSLHVMRLLQRGEPVQAALLLGPPTDLFDMRRRLENGTYIPPFGLDDALIALGFPDREPLRYWRYSGAYHVRDDFPPLVIIHSRSDEVVPYQQSELLAANLSQVGATYELHFFDGASHYLLAEEGDADAIEIYRITLDFLTRNL